MQNFITLGQPLLGEKYVAQKRKEEQAGVELCQAQFKLGLAKQALGRENSVY